MEGAFGRLTYELTIFEVEEEDYGEYTCQASNLEGRGDAQITLYGIKSIHVRVHVLNFT